MSLSRVHWRGMAVALIALFWAGSSTANDRPVSEILGLNPEALSRFVELQDDWFEWLSAVAQGDSTRVSASLDNLLGDAEVLGLRRLPDLSLGAAGRAIAFAEDGRFDAAAQCLAAAGPQGLECACFRQHAKIRSTQTASLHDVFHAPERPLFTSRL